MQSTSWSSQTRNPTQWAGATKHTDYWQANNTHVRTVYTTTPHSTDAWRPTTPAGQLYFYDDINIPYDSLDFYYDSRINRNSANQRLVTVWQGAGV